MNNRSSKPSADSSAGGIVPATTNSLTPLCLGTDDEHPFRRLAWVCSVCAMFLAGGIVGLTAGHRETTPAFPVQPRQIVPVVFEPAMSSGSRAIDTRKVDGTTNKKLFDPAPTTPVAAVAMPDSSVMPVSAADILSPAPESPLSHVPATREAGSRASRYEPAANTPDTPRPTYPSIALRRGYEGTVVVEFTVATSGDIVEVRLRRSSGYAVLDEEVLETVRRRWKFPPGPTRYHYFETVFQLK